MRDRIPLIVLLVLLSGLLVLSLQLLVYISYEIPAVCTEADLQRLEQLTTQKYELEKEIYAMERAKKDKDLQLAALESDNDLLLLKVEGLEKDLLGCKASDGQCTVLLNQTELALLSCKDRVRSQQMEIKAAQKEAPPGNASL